jgi:hypothetical protein
MRLVNPGETLEAPGILDNAAAQALEPLRGRGRREKELESKIEVLKPTSTTARSLATSGWKSGSVKRFSIPTICIPWRAIVD